MISYCICCGRPKTAKLLIEDLVAKTTVPYEILIWLNTDDEELLDLIQKLIDKKIPITVAGSTPADMGMMGYRVLFEYAKYEMVAQIEDDVVCISRGLVERSAEIFKRCPSVRQIVADVVQDRFTDGGRPPIEQYKPFENVVGLYDGPVDGWFSIYHRSVIPSLFEAPYERLLYLGSWARGKLISLGFQGLLYTNIRVFHASGSPYAKFFGILDAEIRKLRALGKHDLADLYESTVPTEKKDLQEMALRYEDVKRELETF